MSVPKHLQRLSDMEYYRVAVRVRRDITNWLLRDFGHNRRSKSLKMVLPEATPEEIEKVNEVFTAHDKGLNKQFRLDYPDWFLGFERKRLIEYAANIVTYIVKANSIFPVCIAELDLRRTYQTTAISICYALFNELEYIQTVLNGDLNLLGNALTDLQREVHLLKGWRQADGKLKSKLKGAI